MANQEHQVSVTIPSQVYGWDGTVKKITTTLDGTAQRLDVSTGLSALPGFSIPPFDRIDATYPTTVQEVYVYSKNGITLNTVTVNYTDATKLYISSAIKT